MHAFIHFCISLAFTCPCLAYVRASTPSRRTAAHGPCLMNTHSANSTGCHLFVRPFDHHGLMSRLSSSIDSILSFFSESRRQVLSSPPLESSSCATSGKHTFIHLR